VGKDNGVFRRSFSLSLSVQFDIQGQLGGNTIIISDISIIILNRPSQIADSRICISFLGLLVHLQCAAAAEELGGH
jgi:hypothetical protein